VSEFDRAVIPGEPDECARNPWFDWQFSRLTTLSELDGASRKVAEFKSFWIPRLFGGG
jgi:hypothetical protein